MSKTAQWPTRTWLSLLWLRLAREISSYWKTRFQSLKSRFLKSKKSTSRCSLTVLQTRSRQIWEHHDLCLLLIATTISASNKMRKSWNRMQMACREKLSRHPSKAQCSNAFKSAWTLMQLPLTPKGLYRTVPCWMDLLHFSRRPRPYHWVHSSRSELKKCLTRPTSRWTKVTF